MPDVVWNDGFCCENHDVDYLDKMKCVRKRSDWNEKQCITYDQAIYSEYGGGGVWNILACIVEQDRDYNGSTECEWVCIIQKKKMWFFHSLHAYVTIHSVFPHFHCGNIYITV